MSDKSNMWDGIGAMFAILSICLGIGGCYYISSKGDADVIRAKTQLIEAETAKIVAENTYPKESGKE